jgi:transposase
VSGKTKLTLAISDKLCSALRAGNYVDTAAAYAGVVKDTFYQWLRRGARATQADDHSKAEAPYRAFHDAVHEAIASSEIRDVALIAKAATEQWQAAAWRLERRYPDRWGKRERIEHVGKDGGSIAIDLKWADGTTDSDPDSADAPPKTD